MSRTTAPIILTAHQVEFLMNRLDALEIMRAAFRSLGAATANQPPQSLTMLPNDAGDFITYLGVLADKKVFGAKISPYLVRKGTAHGTAWTLLLSMETGLPILLCDSKQLTTERTAATTALAVDLLAPTAASRLAVIGMGSLSHMDVYCDYRQTAPSGAAEMRLAAAEHRWSPKCVAGDLAELLAGQASLPSYDRPVFFRSIGLGVEDIAIAHALFEAHTEWTTERER